MKLLSYSASLVLDRLGPNLQLLQLLQELLKVWVAQQAFVLTPIRPGPADVCAGRSLSPASMLVAPEKLNSKEIHLAQLPPQQP